MANSGSIRDFYKRADVLITGGSGFIGKTLVDHLLRKTEVNAIYIIIRSKKGISPEERAKNYFSEGLFSVIKEQNIDLLTKVKFMYGDVSEENLGLTEADRKTLMDNVSIVFHGAATVMFNENLKKAILTNIGGARRMVQLSENMPKLKAFVHVSTAFVYAHLKEGHTPEKIRPRDEGIGPLELLELAKCVDLETAAKMTPVFLGDSNNTYLFTKRAAEALINSCTHLPVGIFRPAVILATKSEPMPGWIDNVYGPTGILMTMGNGLIHLLLATDDSNADIVPVDMTVNCLIASAWDIHNRHNHAVCNGEMGIYNYVSSPDSPLTWRKFLRDVQNLMKVYPPVDRFWHSFHMTTPSPMMYFFLSFWLQFIPAAIADKLTEMFVIGGKARLVNIVKKVDQLNDYFRPFTLRKWKYLNGNVNEMWSRLDAKDQDLFPFSLKNFNWDSYLYNYVQGINLFLLKTTPDKLQKARSTAWKYYWLHCGLIALIFLSIWGSLHTYLCPMVSNMIRYLN